MKYQNVEVGDLSDQQLFDAIYDLQWTLAHRDNRLLDAKLRHKIIDFKTINPAFIKLQSEINDEIKIRKARS